MPVPLTPQSYRKSDDLWIPVRILSRNKEPKQDHGQTQTELLDIIKAKDDRINKLEGQVNELEQTMNKKNIITTTAATTATTTAATTAATTATLKQNVRSSPTTKNAPPTITVDFALQKLNVHLEPYDILAIHDLPPDVTENALSSFSYFLQGKRLN